MALLFFSSFLIYDFFKKEGVLLFYCFRMSTESNPLPASSTDEKLNRRLIQYQKGTVILDEIKTASAYLGDLYGKTNNRSWWWPVLNFNLHLLNPVRDGFRVLKEDKKGMREDPGRFMLALRRVSIILTDKRDISTLIRTHRSKLKVIQENLDEIEQAVQTICTGWEKLRKILNWTAPVGTSQEEIELIQLIQKEVDCAFEKDWISVNKSVTKKKRKRKAPS